MRACLATREGRCVKSKGPDGREPSVAKCATRLNDLRAWPPTATTANLRNVCFREDLRVEAGLLMAAQFRPRRSKALRELEIRQTTKKVAPNRLISALISAISTGNQGKTGGPGPRTTGNNVTKTGIFCASLLLLLTRSAPAADWPTLLGPTRDGVSTEKGIIAPWPKA